eukprot:6913302-Alexandrium_andersonii.AAC.1
MLVWCGRGTWHQIRMPRLPCLRLPQPRLHRRNLGLHAGVDAARAEARHSPPRRRGQRRPVAGLGGPLRRRRPPDG